MRTLAFVSVTLLLLGAAGGAHADPRWAWNDVRVYDGPAARIDIDAVPGPPPVVFLAWTEPVSPIESWLNLAVSFDGGCNFCYPQWVGAVTSDDEEIALAAVEIPVQIISVRRYTVQLLHARGGMLYAIHGTFDISTVSTPSVKCDAFRSAVWSTIRLSDGEASQPDIAGASTYLSPDPVAHFHAVWRQGLIPPEYVVWYARDLAGDGSGWERVGRLPGPAVPAPDVETPQVSVDWRTGDPAWPSAVNVAYGNPGASELLYLRSTDSGTTFSATGDPVPSAPAVVNTPPGPRPARPFALDSGSGLTDDPLWHGLAWVQEMELPAPLELDGQHQAQPALPDPAWGTDTLVNPDVFTGLESLALSVLPGGATEPAPMFVFWTGGMLGSTEVMARGGLLQAGATPAIDLDTFPFPAVRPDDPVLSEGAPITACVIDDALGECLSTRLGGSASQVAADEAEGDLFVAWIDDREGFPRPYFKRTDRGVDPPSPQLAAECSVTDPGRAVVTATFDPLPGCRDEHPYPERVLRYLVYYGTASGGPYENTDLLGSDPGVPDTIVLPDDGLLPDPIVVEIDSLDPSTTYHVLAVAEDEARNVFPPDLDPLSGRPDTPENEASITTPNCSPGRCLYRATAPGRDTSSTFVTPRDPVTDVAFAPPNGVTYGPCPFPSGDPDPERVLAPGFAELVFYQVEGSDVEELRIAVDWELESVRILY